jgi:hypothetical protein
MEWNRIGTTDGRLFYSGYFQGTGMPFSVSDGSPAGTVELFRAPWSITTSFETELSSPVFGSAAFFLSERILGPLTEVQVQRSDGTVTGTFALPPPAGVSMADWKPHTGCKPALLGRYLLVCATATGANGTTWSYDLDPIWEGSFD